MSRNSVGCVAAVLLCLAALLSVSYSRPRPFRSVKAPVGKGLQRTIVRKVLVVYYTTFSVPLLHFVYFRDAETVEIYSVVVPEVIHREQGDGVSQRTFCE